MKTAIFGYNTSNIGDDIQSLAAAVYLNSVDCLVEREQLDRVRLSETHMLIMNSWFMKNRYHAVPSSSIEPIFFGFCVGTDLMINDSWIKYLKKHQPIGCRDQETVDKLSSYGIAAYMTGCLTMRLARRFKPTGTEGQAGVYFVDLPEEIERAVPDHIRARARRFTHAGKRGTLGTYVERFNKLAKIWDELRDAEFVITRRLHVALPCVGFGIPVMVLVEDIPKNRRRFSGYERFLRVVYHDGKLSGDEVNWESRDLARIPEDLEGHFLEFLSSLGESDLPKFRSFSEVVKVMLDEKIKCFPESRGRFKLTYNFSEMFSR